jgi:hypothetical protein
MLPDHGWLDLSDMLRDGTRLQVRFTAEGMIVRRIIPEAIMEAGRAANHAARDLHRKGARQVGGHWLPVSSIPGKIYGQWERELGPRRENEKAWNARLNSNEFRDFRTSEYHL